jgi:hypothetical protein
MRAGDGYLYHTATATDSSTFALNGGSYAVDVLATWGGGSVTLERLGPDGSTYLTAATAFTANGSSTVSLPPGTYKFAVTTATAVYAAVTRIPGE